MKAVVLLIGAVLAGCASHQPPPPHVVVRTPIKLDPAHPPKIGEEYYPAASRRVGEQGRCLVKMTVFADGHVDNISISQSSGFPRLDDACVRGFVDGHFIPATEDGKPVDKSIEIPVTWKLLEPQASATPEQHDQL